MGEFERICKEKGREEVHRETALEMLKDKKPLNEIIKYSKLAKEAIFALAKENGLEVVVGYSTIPTTEYMSPARRP